MLVNKNLWQSMLEDTIIHKNCKMQFLFYFLLNIYILKLSMFCSFKNGLKVYRSSFSYFKYDQYKLSSLYT